jgi:hypothetical protein
MSQISAIRQRPGRPAGAPASSSTDLYLFRLIDRRQFALTCDSTGENIPAYRDGAWQYVRRVQFLPHEVRQDFDPAAVASAIASDGYALIGCPFSDD